MKEQKKWAQNEIDFLIDSVENGISISEIAKELNRSEKSVRIKAQRLNIQLLDYKSKKIKDKFYNYQVQCPFFKSFVDSKKINCEGVIEKSSLSVVFSEHDKWIDNMNIYCCDAWYDCPIAKLLQDKYDGNHS